MRLLWIAILHIFTQANWMIHTVMEAYSMECFRITEVFNSTKNSA